MDLLGCLCWKRLILLSLVIMGTSVDEGDFVYSAASSDWSLSPTEEYVTAWINLTYMDGEKLHTEKTEIGKFGSGKVGPASGIVVHVTSLNRNNSHFGCDFPYGNQVPNEPWIALVKRGNCTFDEKLRNAYRSNASALVVYAREDKDTLDRMSFKDCTYCNIPTVFTYRWKGEEIARHVDRGIRVYMYITVGETVARPYSGINRTSVLFVSISFIVLMVISLAWLVFYYVQRFRYLHAKDRLAQRLCNAAKKALAKIPTRNIKLTDKEMSAGDGECCAVCIEMYRSGETLRTLPCRHEFHKSCVDPWLLEHRTCPMCKMDILKYYGYIQFSGSQESILHLDMEEGVLNSSESRETESPSHDNQRHHRHPFSGHPEVTTTTTTAIREPVEQHPTLNPHVEQTERNPSLVYVTVVSIPKGLKQTSEESKPVCEAECQHHTSLIPLEGQGSTRTLENVDDGLLTHPPTEKNLHLGDYPVDSAKLKSFPGEDIPDSQKFVPVTVHQTASSSISSEASLALNEVEVAIPRSQSREDVNYLHVKGMSTPNEIQSPKSP